MAATFLEITEPDEWERLRARSADGPIPVFKHDPYCSISLVARRELSRVEGEIPVIDVAGSKALSLEVARQTGVRHESPQVIVLRDGEAAWSASHFAISAAAVEAALAPVSLDADGEPG